MERLVKSLLDLSSLEIEAAASEDAIDVVRILEALIADYRFLTEPRDIRIEVRLPEQLIVKGNAEKLNRAFSNILDNAVKYNVDGGRIDVIGDQSGTDLMITITNTGPGVAEAETHKVFDQFYRVEESRSLRYGGSGSGACHREENRRASRREGEFRKQAGVLDTGDGFSAPAPGDGFEIKKPHSYSIRPEAHSGTRSVPTGIGISGD